MIYDPFSMPELKPRLPGRYRSGLSVFCEGSCMWKAGLPLSFSHKDLSTFSPTFADPSLFQIILAGGEGTVFSSFDI